MIVTVLCCLVPLLQSWAVLIEQVCRTKYVKLKHNLTEQDHKNDKKTTTLKYYNERCHLFVPQECSNAVGRGLQTLAMCSLVVLCSVHLRTSLWNWSCPPAWSGWWDTVSYSAPPVSNGTFRRKITTGLLICGTAPALSIAHRQSVAVCRVQVINQDCISEEVFKHCKGSTRQEVLRPLLWQN